MGERFDGSVLVLDRADCRCLWRVVEAGLRAMRQAGESSSPAVRDVARLVARLATDADLAALPAGGSVRAEVAEAAGGSEQTFTSGQVALQLGVTARRVRQLAVESGWPIRRGPRNELALTPSDVTGLRQQMGRRK